MADHSIDPALGSAAHLLACSIIVLPGHMVSSRSKETIFTSSTLGPDLSRPDGAPSIRGLLGPDLPFLVYRPSQYEGSANGSANRPVPHY